MGWNYTILKKSGLVYEIEFTLKKVFLSSEIRTLKIDFDSFLSLTANKKELDKVETLLESLKNTSLEDLLYESLFNYFGAEDISTLCKFIYLSDRDERWSSTSSDRWVDIAHEHINKVEIDYLKKTYLSSLRTNNDRYGDLDEKEICHIIFEEQLYNKFEIRQRSQDPEFVEIFYKAENAFCLNYLNDFAQKKSELLRKRKEVEELLIEAKEQRIKRCHTDKNIFISPMRYDYGTSYKITRPLNFYTRFYVEEEGVGMFRGVGDLKYFYINKAARKIEFVYLPGSFNHNLKMALNIEFQFQCRLDDYYHFSNHDIKLNIKSLYLSNPINYSTLKVNNGVFEFCNETEFKPCNRYFLINFFPPNPIFVEEDVYAQYHLSSLNFEYLNFPKSLPEENVYKTNIDGVENTFLKIQNRINQEPITEVEHVTTVKEVKVEINKIAVKLRDSLFPKIHDEWVEQFKNGLELENISCNSVNHNAKYYFINSRICELFLNELFNKNKTQFKVPFSKHKFVISRTRELENHDFGILAEKVVYNYLQINFCAENWKNITIQNLLSKHNYLSKADSNIIWLNQTAESYKPYDIKIEFHNQNYFIDVKATRGEDKNIFYLSISELKLLILNPKNYFIARVNFIEEETEYDSIKLNSELCLNFYMCKNDTLNEIKNNIEEWEKYYNENKIRFSIEHFQQFDSRKNIFKDIEINMPKKVNFDIDNFEKQFIEKKLEAIFWPIDKIQNAFREFEEFRDFMPFNIPHEKERFLLNIWENFKTIKQNYKG